MTEAKRNPQTQSFKLSPDVYSNKAVSGQPDCLFKLPDGNWWIDPKRIVEGESGPFNLVANYGQSLEELREPIEVDYWPKGITFHNKENKIVSQAFNNLSLLVGMGDEKGLDIADTQFGALYAANFTQGFKEPFQKAVADWWGKDWTLLSPLRGGRVVQEISKALGYNPRIPQIRASRVMVKNNEESFDKTVSYLIGVRRLEPQSESRIEISDLVLFGDDCCAAAGSEDTILRWAQSLNGGLKEIRSVVGVGVKRAIEGLCQTWENGAGPMAKHYHVGAEANAMNEKYYLILTDAHRQKENLPKWCKYRVGDMGKAMDFSDSEREKILLPIVHAVAQGKISSEEIFERTAMVVENPDQLDFQASKLLAAC